MRSWKFVGSVLFSTLSLAACGGEIPGASKGLEDAATGTQDSGGGTSIATGETGGQAEGSGGSTDTTEPAPYRTPRLWNRSFQLTVKLSSVAIPPVSW